VSPACVTEKISPAILMVAARPVVPGFGDTLNVTDPLSVPDAPPVIVSHVALLTAVQGQPGAIRTATVPVPDDDGNAWLDGVIDAPHTPENEKVLDRSL